MNRRVNLTKLVLIDGVSRYCPVATADNGRVKPDWVIVGGSPERHPEGAYYIDWNEKGKRIRRSVGKSASQALARQLRKETELKAKEQGIALAPEDDTGSRIGIAGAVATYLEEIKITKKGKTYAAYSTALEYFQESCTKSYVEDIERRDLLHFSAYLRDEKDQSPRSCRNKFGNVMTFLKAMGRQKIVNRGDWPRFVQEEPEAYEREELEEFLGACDPTERMVFEFFLMTGFREQEVMYADWKDVNFRQNTVSMRWKPQYNWMPKAYKEREVPVPLKLIESLGRYRPTGSRIGLLFPTPSGGANGHFHRMCKDVAKRTKLDVEGWWLHKFRATFATWHLQAGVDLRTVQKWLGHVDLESTMRYLRPARGAVVHEKVNATFA